MPAGRIAAPEAASVFWLPLFSGTGILGSEVHWHGAKPGAAMAGTCPAALPHGTFASSPQQVEGAPVSGDSTELQHASGVLRQHGQPHEPVQGIRPTAGTQAIAPAITKAKILFHVFTVLLLQRIAESIIPCFRHSCKYNDQNTIFILAKKRRIVRC